MKSPLNSPFHGDVKPAPSPMDKFGVCDEGSPDSIKGHPNTDDVLGRVFYVKSEGLNGSPASLSSPFGTAIPNPKRSNML